jgi:hypothetical protein
MKTVVESYFADDLNPSIATVPSFPGLRRFPQGRKFKQWTGDDSKALMKVRSLFTSRQVIKFQ